MLAGALPWKETPTCRFEQFVDLDTGGGFLIYHLISQYYQGLSGSRPGTLRE
jgi:hypothetical protein